MPSYADRQQASERYPGAKGQSADIVQRWRDLRTRLIQQLDMFETGALTLRSNGVNISEDAIADLKRDISEFDSLIAVDEAQIAPSSKG
jgi:hypothetical protein